MASRQAEIEEMARPAGRRGLIKFLDGTAYLAISFILLMLVATAAFVLALQQRWMDATALAALAMLGFAFLGMERMLPRMFTLLFILAALVNTAGYVFSLWHQLSYFDEAVHFFTSFTVMAAIGWIILSLTSVEDTGTVYVLLIVGLGFVIGVFWELFEYVIGIIGSGWDTSIDILMDVAGAICAAGLCSWLASSQSGLTEPN